jgi:hypothetical protein
MAERLFPEAVFRIQFRFNSLREHGGADPVGTALLSQYIIRS